MTPLEQWDDGNFSTEDFELDAAIRRGLARSQALEEWENKYGTADVVAMEINNRTEELLAGKK